MNLEEKIKNLIEPIIKSQGYTLLKVELRFQKRGKNLIISLNKEGGLSVEDCAKISRLIDPILEKEDLIKTKYYLVVSSPGIKR